MRSRLSALFVVPALVLGALALGAAPAQAKAGRRARLVHRLRLRHLCRAGRRRSWTPGGRSSPYSAVGIYIGGSNRLCKDQPKLTADWVADPAAHRLADLCRSYVGPQASCSGYADKMSSDLATAHQQGIAEAATAVAAAQGLGIGSRRHALLRPRGLPAGRHRLPAGGAQLPLRVDRPAARDGLPLRRLLQHRRRDHLARPRGPGLARRLHDARRHLVRLGQRPGRHGHRRQGPERRVGRPPADPPVRPRRPADLGRLLAAEDRRQLARRRPGLGRHADQAAVPRASTSTCAATRRCGPARTAPRSRRRSASCASCTSWRATPAGSTTPARSRP